MRLHTSGTGRRVAALRTIATVLLTVLAGCSWQDLVKAKLPPTTADPEALKTEEGAISLYHGAIHAFRRGFGGANTGYVVIAGRLSDELTTGAYATGDIAPMQPGSLDEIDARDMPEDAILRSTTVESWYRLMNMGRNQAVDAIFYLRNYAPLQPKDLVGHMFAIRGLTMTYLADFFCSGIPLTNYTSPGGYEYEPGISTDSVYERAVAEYDSALANVGDSLNFKYLAEVGKARALLDLGKFQEAAAAVQDVPTDFVYKARYAVDYVGSFSNNWVWGVPTYTDPENGFGTIGDREGINGLPFVSSHDPRVPLISSPIQSTTYPLTNYTLPAWMFPNDNFWHGTSTKPKNGEDIVVASGIEARLAEAEAKANAGDASFLTILNTLRTSCTDAATCPDPAPAGTGGVAGLPPLTDPGDQKARIKMVYDERAYWTFLTGIRQGDLRRLVRVYGWPQDEVYPTGPYPIGAAQAYGRYTNVPIPNTERAINQQYKGCINRDA